jgi:hypothetical protein
MQFLDRFDMHDRCFTLQSPSDLNDRERVAQLIEFLDLPRRSREISFAGRRNVNPQPTVVNEEDRRQFAEIVAILPVANLGIFSRPPYAQWDWSELLASRPLPLAQSPVK